MRKYTKVSEEEIVKSNFVTIKNTKFITSLNKESNYYRWEFTNWVNVAPITKDNEIILIKQYRIGIEDFSIEIPGGIVEINEDPVIAAERELLEETGCRCSNLELLNKVTANPAINNNYVYGYIGYGAEIVQKQNLDENEDIEIIKKPLKLIPDMIKSGEIDHPYAIITLLLVLNKMGIDYKI